MKRFWKAKQKEHIHLKENVTQNIEIEPPWIAYPGQEPWWSGWRQGEGEFWFDTVWFPYWNLLNREERIAYADKWDAPGHWREHIIVKLSKESVCIQSEVGDPTSDPRFCFGLEMAVVGVNAGNQSMRLFVKATGEGFGASYDAFWVHVDDFDRFCNELLECARTHAGTTRLLCTGEDEYCLEVVATEPGNGFLVRFLLAWHIKAGSQQHAHRLSGVFYIDSAKLQRAADEIPSLRVDPKMIRTYS